MFWAVLIFLIGFVFFESILNISGHDYGKLGQAALPVLLIIIGVTLLVRNFQRGRSG
jgi:membrane protein DedA with SNARE-associated domain